MPDAADPADPYASSPTVHEQSLADRLLQPSGTDSPPPTREYPTHVPPVGPRCAAPARGVPALRPAGRALRPSAGAPPVPPAAAFRVHPPGMVDRRRGVPGGGRIGDHHGVGAAAHG